MLKNDYQKKGYFIKIMKYALLLIRTIWKVSLYFRVIAKSPRIEQLEFVWLSILNVCSDQMYTKFELTYFAKRLASEISADKTECLNSSPGGRNPPRACFDTGVVVLHRNKQLFGRRSFKSPNKDKRFFWKSPIAFLPYLE